jgi:glutathione synthase/RimK-type ligase-like ATP-grasp enzyme
MKKVLVLTRLVKEYEPKRLAEEGRTMGHEVSLIKYGQVNLGVSEGKMMIDIDGYDVNDFDLIIPRAATKKGSSMVSVKTAILASVDPAKILNGVSFSKYPLLGKIEQGLLLADKGLPVVDFWSFGNKKGWAEFRAGSPFGFPMMVKGRFGSHGRAVKLVNDWEQFDRAAKNYSEGAVLVQPVIKAKQWYRTIVVCGEYLGEMRHRQKDKYGAVEGTLVKQSSTKMKRLKEISLEAAKTFDVEYAGIDILWDEDRQDFAILEVNRTAQFKYFERKTGVNVAGKIFEKKLS